MYKLNRCRGSRVGCEWSCSHGSVSRRQCGLAAPNCHSIAGFLIRFFWSPESEIR